MAEKALHRVLAVRHEAEGGMGRVGAELQKRSVPVNMVNFVEDPHLSVNINDYSALIVFGGSISANDKSEWLLPELYLIERVLRGRIPLMGICLGAQLIAKALGKRVMRAEPCEVGWSKILPSDGTGSDFLFGELTGEKPVFQWHYDTYELPDGAVRLARSVDCEEQAFRWGERVYGMQFHLEMGAEEIDFWKERDMACGEGRELPESLDPRLHERETSEFAGKVFGRFFDLALNG